MKKQRITSIDAPEPADKLWSNCLRAGNNVYIAGLTALEPDRVNVVGDTEYEQTITIFKKMKALIEASGAAMDDIVALTIYVTDIKNNEGVWKARQEFFTGDFPTCALVEVSALAKPNLLVEIQGTAIAGCSA